LPVCLSVPFSASCLLSGICSFYSFPKNVLGARLACLRNA
jgi:hypothetical protein